MTWRYKNLNLLLVVLLLLMLLLLLLLLLLNLEDRGPLISVITFASRRRLNG